MIIKNLTSSTFYSFKILQSINAQTKIIIPLLMPILLVSILPIGIVNQTSSAQQTPINNATTTLTDPNALINQGADLFTSGRFNESIQYFDKALAINPNDEVALDSKGAALYMLGRFNESIQYFDKALAINPNDAYASDTKNL